MIALRFWAAAGAAALWACLANHGFAAETPRPLPALQPFAGRFVLSPGDVVAFVGGANVVAAQETGHLESLLAVKFRGVRFRNLGWEADTVFAQPRDLNFPPLTNQLARVGATIVFAQFGQSESLRGRDALPGFVQAYEKMLADFARQTPRLVLVTPPPFEKDDGLRPDLSARNDDLAAYAGAIRELARRRGFLLVDLFDALSDPGGSHPRLTDNGLHLTQQGQAIVAQTVARQFGFADLAARAGPANAKGEWADETFERIRRAVVMKNRLWFDYWRPMNWAFLAGDRTEQPSSHDHRDPKIRWFPAEMEKFMPLIQQEEARIETLADAASPK